MASVWRSRTIGIATTLIAKTSPANTPPTARYATMDARFRGADQGQRRALEVGHAVEAEHEHEERCARPQRFQDQQDQQKGSCAPAGAAGGVGPSTGVSALR